MMSGLTVNRIAAVKDDGIKISRQQLEDYISRHDALALRC